VYYDATFIDDFVTLTVDEILEDILDCAIESGNCMVVDNRYIKQGTD
jgi:hypothetical protein